MSPFRGVLATTGAVLLLTLAVVVPGAADRLVLRDGIGVDTDGPWEIQGRLVVFRDPDGQLRSLRADEVDLEASRRATAEAKRTDVAPGEEAKTPAEPILRLTEVDLPPVDDPGASADPGAGAVAPATSKVTLYATSWCGWCRKTRSLLAELGVDYVERDVERDPAARREQLRLTGGSSGVPVIDWNGMVVRGYAERTLRTLAQTSRPEPPTAPARDSER